MTEETSGVWKKPPEEEAHAGTPQRLSSSTKAAAWVDRLRIRIQKSLKRAGRFSP